MFGLLILVGDLGGVLDVIGGRARRTIVPIVREVSRRVCCCCDWLDDEFLLAGGGRSIPVNPLPARQRGGLGYCQSGG